MSKLNRFFTRKIADIHHMNIDQVTDQFVFEKTKKRKGKLKHLRNAFMGGHVVSKFLKHIDKDDRKKLYAQNEKFLEQFTKSP